MSDKFFVGLDITAFQNNGQNKPVSRVTLWVDDNNCLTAGDDTGMELEADCPFATQTMVDSILAQIQGYQYQAYTASDADIDPAAELGDGVTVNGVYSVLARIDDDGSGYPSISAPGEQELEEEYPTTGPMTQEFNRQIAETRSEISKTAEEIRLEVAQTVGDLSASFSVQLESITAQITGLDGQISTVEQTVSSITTRITGLERDFSSIEQYVDSITLSVSNGSTSSTIRLQAGSTTISSANITFSGMVTFSDLSSSGGTVINGSNITTGTIYADRIHLGGDLTVYQTLTSNTVGGYMGYTTSSQDGSAGIHMRSDAGEVVATANGAKMLFASDSRQIYIAYANAGIDMVEAHYRFSWTSFYETSGVTLGTSAYPWGQIYSTNSTISTSDENLKHDIEPLPEKYVAMLDSLEPKRFKYNDGTSGRDHPGFVAQDVKAAMDAAGIDSAEFGGWCKDVDADGNEIQMLRYEEFIPILLAKIKQLESHIAVLEAV